MDFEEKTIGTIEEVIFRENLDAKGSTAKIHYHGDVVKIEKVERGFRTS